MFLESETSFLVMGTSLGASSLLLLIFGTFLVVEIPFGERLRERRKV